MESLRKMDRYITEVEAKARGHIAGIIPLLYDLPEDGLARVEHHLSEALNTARLEIEKMKAGGRG